MLKDYNTKEILEELTKRKAVQHIWVKPYEEIHIEVNRDVQNLLVKEGPARIALIYD